MIRFCEYDKRHRLTCGSDGRMDVFIASGCALFQHKINWIGNGQLGKGGITSTAQDFPTAALENLATLNFLSDKFFKTALAC